MKKFLPIVLICHLLAFTAVAQDPVFNNSGEGNNFYSNAENWANATKPSNDGRAQFNGTARLDESVTLSYIKASVMSAGLLTGGGTLTLSGGDQTFVDIQQFTTGDFLLDIPIIYTATDPTGRNLFRVDADGGSISFGPNSDLELSSTNPVRLQGFPGAAAFAKFNFDGILRGSSNMQLGINVDTVFFGATSDNSNYTGQIIYFSPGSTIIANNDEGNQLVAPSNKIQVNNTNGTLVLNGRNIYQGFIQIDGANAFRWEINADQPNLERIVIPGSGNITIALGDDVDMVHFNDLSGDQDGSLWDAAATVNIENFRSGVFRFGTNNEGLTATQVGQINIGGGTPSLNSLGFLIDESVNTAPEASSISDITLQEGFGSREVDLSAFFSDPQNDALTFSAASSASLVTVSTDGNTLTITEAANGTSTITVTCTDEFGLSTESSFDVLVTEEVVDSDGDGVPDDSDLCANTPAGAEVDADGCADSQKDTDGDGVMDDMDLCPETPAGADVDADGCADSQKDTDGDGVMDDMDLCSETPAGADVDADGCADSQRDTDGDGVNDDVDLCPGTAANATVDASGCAVLAAAEIENSDLRIYPNPATDYFKLKSASEWNGGVLSIHDMSGKMILSQTIENSQDEVSIRHLKAGRYILHLRNDTEEKSVSFIKNN